MTLSSATTSTHQIAGTHTVAAVFRGTQQQLSIEKVITARPGASEVQLRVSACGACHSDVHKLQGHGLVEAPCVFGHEISGVIVAVGQDVRDLHIGDRVACSFLVPCGECTPCSAGDEDNCGPFRSRMQNAGVRFDGTFRMFQADGKPLRTSGIGGLAGEITMPARGVFRLPDDWPEDIPLEDVSVLGCAGLTAYGAVYRAAQVQDGQNVLVLGAGGVGLCTTALARHAGAVNVVTTDIKETALTVATDFGATHTVRVGSEGMDEEISIAFGGESPDVVFDTIGTSQTLRQALAAVRVGGQVVVTGLGGTSGPASIDDLPAFVRRKVTIVGSYAGLPSHDMPLLLDAVRNGAFTPGNLISARYPFGEAARAYEDVATGKITGRAIILGPVPDLLT